MTKNYNDGNWHGWNGGDCPVHPESVVDAVWPAVGNETKAFRAQRKAKGFAWYVSDASGPLLFRVVEEHKEPREWWIVNGDALFASLQQAENHRTLYYPSWPITHVREVTE